MLTLILAALLLGPMAPDADPLNSPEKNRGPDTLTAQTICAPPLIGDWVIDADCLMVGDQVAAGAVLVVGGSTLELGVGASLDIDFLAERLEIDATSRVIVGPGARIF